MEMPWKAQPPAYIRLLAVEMVEDGDSVEHVAGVFAVTQRSVWRWLRAWNSGGQAALTSSPRSGRPPKIDTQAASALLSWLDRSPCEFGFRTERWTARRLASVLLREKGIGVNHRYLSDWLARHDITPQLPQRVPHERDDAKVAAWAAEQWPRIKKKCAGSTPPSVLPMKAAFF
jgi:transposase